MGGGGPEVKILEMNPEAINQVLKQKKFFHQSKSEKKKLRNFSEAENFLSPKFFQCKKKKNFFLDGSLNYAILKIFKVRPSGGGS